MQEHPIPLTLKEPPTNALLHHQYHKEAISPQAYLNMREGEAYNESRRVILDP